MNAIYPCCCTMLLYINLTLLHISILSSPPRWTLNSVRPAQTSSGTSRRFSCALKSKRWSTSVSHSVGTTTRRRYPKVTALHKISLCGTVICYFSFSFTVNKSHVCHDVMMPARKRNCYSSKAIETNFISSPGLPYLSPLFTTAYRLCLYSCLL